MGVAEAMGAALERTAQSVNIKERLDFSCALFDAGGGLVANAPHMPVHLGSWAPASAPSATATRVSRRRGLRAQQPLRRRHPPARHHGGHAGVHGADAPPAFWVAARGHHADVGGVQPGSMPPFSTTSTRKACMLDALPIMAGRPFLERDARAAAGRPWPGRAPDRNLADLKAQVAACQAGAAAVAA
jgi:5-oxoprolinase (ATP-hydrolysing)